MTGESERGRYPALAEFGGRYGAPGMLFALLLGMAMNFLSEEKGCRSGIEFTARRLLRVGVALLGLRVHDQVSEVGVERCRAQILGVARSLDPDRSQRTGLYWSGECMGHADIVVATVLHFVSEAHPGLLDQAVG